MHDEFPQDESLIYLNHAGVSPWPKRTADAVAAFAGVNARRGAADYPAWLRTEARLREQLAWLVGAEGSDDITLVANTSEGLSMVAHGLRWRAGDNVVINDQEFPSNRMVWESLAERHEVEIREVTLTGAEDPEGALIDAMDEYTRVLPVSAVQYGSGLRIDLERLGSACSEAGALFCVDAIQQLGALPFDATAVGADFVVADGHKWMMGPEGLGVLYTTPAAREALELNRFGWHMAEALGDFDRRDWAPAASGRRFEAGSPNMLGIHALSASLSLIEDEGIQAIGDSVMTNARTLLERIADEPALSAVTPVAPERHAGIVTFRVAGVADPGDLLGRLRGAGIPCAARAGGIRFSPHFYNTGEQLHAAVDRVLALAGG
ncbi:aminotransferase class V-fold PLP-dependent enzyme [Arhodomonas aquaeolei]|uniref:aminotransferase class V-fold PLP-dependent enzyme n=1 Tax=Arhodomonas aquaeolei TaxID=2369 RepID=UPI002166F7EB|nr:aminotransferase class V-fold PLP-dependent enzyme [Arhodomonas aquaeolei]MCS4503335.1 aminotransferase class V-fold PLP-dependent enzyme [Arhodomonas aquaeolei]